MNNFEFRTSTVAVIADLHIGIHQSTDLWLNITYEWATWLAETLRTHGVKDIVIAGDVFHYRSEISVNVLHKASQIFDLWSEFNIIILCGNHDSFLKESSEINSISILKNRDHITVVEKDPMYVTSKMKRIGFIPWGVSLEDIKPCDILFGHFEVTTFKVTANSVWDKGGVTPEELTSLSPLTLTGHFHIRQERIYGKKEITYVGNPFQMDLNDAGDDKGIYLLDITTGKKNFIVNNISPRIHKVTISDIIDKKISGTDLKDLFHNNLIRLVIDKAIAPEKVDAIITKLQSLQPLLVTPVFEATFQKYGNIDQQENIPTGIDIEDAIGEFVKLMDIEDKDKHTSYVVELYKTCKGMI